MFQGTLQTVSILQTRPVNRLVCHYGNFKNPKRALYKRYLHIPSITSRNSLRSVALCPQVVVPAASSSNTQCAVEVEGDNGGYGYTADCLNTNDARELQGIYSEHRMVPCVDEWVGCCLIASDS